MSILAAALPFVHISPFASPLSSTLPPAQEDNLLPAMPYSSADLAEEAAYSIAQTIAEETASYHDRLVEADRSAELERLAVADGWFAPVLAAF